MQDGMLYGFRACDTVRKARRWIESKSIPYRFIDTKLHGVPQDKFDLWANDVGWEKLINQKSVTFRGLCAEETRHLDRQSAYALVSTYPAVLRRPIFYVESRCLIGFDPKLWETCLRLGRVRVV